MQRKFKAGLALLAGAALLLTERGRGGPRRVLAGARRLVRRKPVVDEALEVEVRAELAKATAHADTIHAEVEHGCVVLSGDVLTTERARLVREISEVPSVDSVVDVMTEHRSSRELVPALRKPTIVSESPPPLPRRRLAAFRRELPLPARVVAGGAGLGLAIASSRLRSLYGIPLGILGVILFARALAARSVASSIDPPMPSIVTRRSKREAKPVSSAHI